MSLTLQQKIDIACKHANITKTELGKKLGMSQASISKRLKTGKFTQEELEKIAEVLNCKYYSGFIFSDGNKIE